jgi:Transposase DDE domain
VRRGRAGPPGRGRVGSYKGGANAADPAKRTPAKLEDEVAQLLRQAAETDQAVDRQDRPAWDDELPPELANAIGRLARLQQAKARLEAEAAERQRRYQQRVADLAAAARAKGKQPRAHGKPSGSRCDGLCAAMLASLTSEQGRARYATRKQTVEPVLGQLREQQGARRFLRRGLAACDAGWKLLCGTHNLLKALAAYPPPGRSDSDRHLTTANAAPTAAPTDSTAARPPWPRQTRTAQQSKLLAATSKRVLSARC